MSKSNNVTDEDVLQILKWVVFIVALALPFIIWDKVNGVTNNVVRIGILLGTEIATPAFVILFIKSIIADDIDWTIKVGSVIYSLVGIIGVFCQISFFADSWNWSAWIIFLITWALFGFAWWQLTK